MGSELHRNDIHDLLIERGVVIEGDYPVNNVGARLSADPRFVSRWQGRVAAGEPATGRRGRGEREQSASVYRRSGREPAGCYRKSVIPNLRKSELCGVKGCLRTDIRAIIRDKEVRGIMS